MSDIKFGLLGSWEVRTVQDNQYHEKFRAMLDRMAKEPAVKRPSWLPRSVKLDVLNSAVNKNIKYIGDFEQHQVRDYWQTPYETLSKMQGDCEDIAILKYVLFARPNSRVALVWTSPAGQCDRVFHAVCVVKENDTWYILDNLYDHPARHDLKLDYVPVTSFDRKNIWRHVVSESIRKQFVDEIMRSGV